MLDFFKFLFSDPAIKLIIIVSFCIALTALILMYVVAFFQGREINLWPPRIGAKPENKSSKVEKAKAPPTKVTLDDSFEVSSRPKVVTKAIERFEGTDGHRMLLGALCAQRLIGNHKEIALKFAEKLQLIELAAGQTLVVQNAPDNDLYLILIGRVKIFVNGREVDDRGAGMHIGEMALIDPSAPRAATVIAYENTVVGKVTEPDFTSIADMYPPLWRTVAVVVSERLRQVHHFIPRPNSPLIATISFSEKARDVAKELETELKDRWEMKIGLEIRSLLRAKRLLPDFIDHVNEQMGKSDFMILVLGNSDGSSINIESGIAIGKLTRKRIAFVIPKGHKLKESSQELGITIYEYTGESKQVLTNDIISIGREIRKQIEITGAK